MALSYLYTLLGKDAFSKKLPFLENIDQTEKEIIRQQIEQKINSPLTSSCGRLFDGVSALTGLRGKIDYEAQAAIELEMAADRNEKGSYPFVVDELAGTRIIRLKSLFMSIIRDIENRLPAGTISMKFHNTLANITVDVCRMVARDSGIKRVALSGGVFQNRLLFRLVTTALEGAGFEVYTHRLVPTNDGGISLGQAVIANFYRGAADVSGDTG
jgi:hydrogenase maturation protein HypF